MSCETRGRDDKDTCVHSPALAVALVGAAIWAMLTGNQLSTAWADLSATMAELSPTKADLESTKVELVDTKTELAAAREGSGIRIVNEPFAGSSVFLV